MYRFLKLFTVFSLSLLFAFSLFAQDRFDRSAEIPAELAAGDIGGWGNIVAGVDLDNDGKLEIYAVTNDWFDRPGLDFIPRLYKYEKDADGVWQIVWTTRLALNAQNSWPALAVADLDKDGKGEIVWGPVNNFAGGANPERIVVYEIQAEGSDVMGVASNDPIAGDYYRPNAQWKIASGDNQNLRPFRWHIQDVDGDNVDEIVASARVGDGIQIYSVDDVPDEADSTETWKLEFSGVTGTFYDIAILNGTIYGIRDNGDVYAVKSAEADSFFVADTQVAIAGRGAWNSAVSVDVDGDNTDEMIVASWSSSDNDVYLLQQDADTLKSTMIQDVPSSSFRSYGGAAGDLDNDGNVDFIFGTRQSSPNGIIHRLEYQGGAIDNSASWQLSVIDQGVSAAQQYDMFAMTDIDEDGEDEAIYTGTARGVSQGDPPQPIVVMDRIAENQPVITDVADVPNDQGRQVWVIWKGSSDDMVPDLKKESVSIAINAPKGVEFPFARINDLAVNTVPVGQELSTIAAAGDIVDYVVWRIDGDGLPVHVSTTRSIQTDMYASVVPTLGDSIDTKYVVSAHTATPALNWKSFAKTGFSEDNLIPSAPGKVAAKEAETGIEVSWEESPDVDFNYFSIRRGTESGFDAANISTEIGTTTSINFLDEGISNDTPYFYRVVAYDFNGNQGELSAEVSAVVSDIEGLSQAIPTEFALNQNYPNPFNPTTTIAFDLPENVDVSIVIYNTLGHKVRTLVNESKVAGSYRTVWDGLNDSGARVATGIYIYNIRAGKFTESRRMTLIK